MRSDKELQRAVEQELFWEPSVGTEHIGVAVRNGVVELSGHVSGYAEKWGAERAALRVADVKGVASEIRVELPTSHVRSDDVITRAAVNLLEWNLLVPDSVKVQVTDGRLTLTGAAEWQYQKEEAERAVRPLTGVRCVLNQIIVTPRASAERVKSKIEEAFKRSAEIDASHIEVEASGDTVTLRGNVRSWAERQEAERVAWAAPGVSKVEDFISVS